MKVLCSGDRHWHDPKLVRAVLERLPPGSIIVHGDQGSPDDVPLEEMAGLDRIAGRVATSLGFEVRPYPADWQRGGIKAGPIRNKNMLKAEEPDLVYAFHDDIQASRGTKNLIEAALDKHIPITLFSHAQPDGLLVRAPLWH